MNLKRSLALAISVLMILTMPFAFGAGETLDRIAGSNRWETAVKISQEGWTSAGTVVLANGRNYPDALAGVPLAHALNAPVLLTEADSLVAATKAEIVRLGAAKVIILGGTGVISDDVAEELEDLGLAVERISGADRYETAAAIAAQVAPAGVDTVVLAYGRGYADALAAASYAAVNGYPILLTEKNSLPDATKKAIEDLGATNVIVVGGTGVIAANTVSGLPGVTRVSGSNREATSVALAEHFAPQTNMFFIATGDGFADAITGAVLAAKEGTGILLVRSSFPSVVGDFFGAANVVEAIVFGGTGVVSETIATAAAKKLTPAGGTGIAGWTTANAVVKVGSRTTTADKYGFYMLTGIAPGKQAVSVTLDNYEIAAKSVNVTKDKISVLDVDLVAIKAEDITISGVVVNSDGGRGLADVKVGVKIWNAKTSKWVNSGLTAAVSGGNGYFSIANAYTDGEGLDAVEVNPLDFGDKVRLTFSLDGFHVVTKDITLAQYAEENTVPGFSMTEILEMDLSVVVTDGTDPVVGVDVTLYDADDEEVAVALTDDDGEYIFNDIQLLTGKYYLLFEKDGYADNTVNVSVTEGKNATVNAKLVAGYTVTFILRTEELNGKFNEATFSAGLYQGGTKTHTLTFNAPETWATDGEAELTFVSDADKVANGTYTLRVSGNHVIQKDFSVVVKDDDYTGYGRAKIGTAITGTTATGATVELINVKTKAVVATTTAHATSGAYAFRNLAAGEYRVRASKAGYVTKTLPVATDDPIELELNAAQTQDITLSANPTLGLLNEGTIRDQVSMAAAYDADTDDSAEIVYYYKNVVVDGETMKAGTVAKNDDGNELRAFVDSDGLYSFDNIYPGTYTVVIRHPGSYETYVTTRNVVAGEQFDNLNYYLREGGNGAIELAITDSDRTSIVNNESLAVTLEDAFGEAYAGAYDSVSGKFVIDGLSAGTYDLVIEYPDHDDIEATVTVARGGVVARSYQMKAEATCYDVNFGITDGQHTAVSAIVEVWLGSSYVDEKDNSGGTFSLPKGTYTLRVYADGYYMAEQTVTVTNAAVDVPVIVVTPWK